MATQNCWEFNKCGREPRGAKTGDLGVCPASTESRVNGMNQGLHGGRVCWAVSGTFCGGQVQGSFAMKLANCMDCEFYKLVAREETANYSKAKDILARLTG
jgi:hypothetical protein